MPCRRSLNLICVFISIIFKVFFTNEYKKKRNNKKIKKNRRIEKDRKNATKNQMEKLLRDSMKLAGKEANYRRRYQDVRMWQGKQTANKLFNRNCKKKKKLKKKQITTTTNIIIKKQLITNET